ncbi:hypothetical protein F5141DRAFT_1120837 [Pisolithus sp. B1]|nr:hypothetical protein F5141DRAFT_1120837 [Pisolithus sp. B1]
MKKQASDVRKPYNGPVRSLVIALDVGTTFSGVSYAILEPGEVPKIYGVTRFPGQEHVAGNCKIPSILYYDQNGTVMAAGAEAEGASIISQAEDEYWIKAELFKLRLRPIAMKLDMNGMRLSSLPRNKAAVDVFGDFLNYLFRCTRNFIIDTHANGEGLWRAVEQGIEFVLSHPNGWEGAQQTKMRRAAVYGGLVPDTDEGRARIRFVTEGEASLHACIQSGLAADVLSNPSRHGFLVADAGGGTLDISSYAVRGTQPLVIEEIAPPDSEGQESFSQVSGVAIRAGRAADVPTEKLKNSKYGTPDAIDHITKRFDETTKRLFRDKSEIQWVPFGSPLDKDVSVGIRGGSLKLTWVAELFEPSVRAAVASIKSQVEASQGMIKSVWLVGGFAASPWLFSQLQERLAPLKIRVSRPDSQTSKAVADGALGFYCDHHVSARVSRFMYGVEYLREYDPNDSDHVARKDRLCELPSGPRLLPDAFDCILARGVKVKESTVFTRKYCTELTNLVYPIYDFSTLCVVRADLSPLSGSAEPKHGKNGKTYWTIVFSIEIHFGLTEFRARIKWNDNVSSIVYNESGHRAEEDEQDSHPEDDFGPSRSASRTASRAASRAASVAPSRTHSRDSMASGAKTPLGVSRQEQTRADVPDRHHRTTSISQSTTAAEASAAAVASVYSERTREVEYEQTVSSSRISSSVTHVERDRKISSSTTKVSTTAFAVDEKRGRESTKERAKAKEKEKQEQERREKLERERERERKESEEKERKAYEKAQREREEAERKEREWEEMERQEREQREREDWERQERERVQRENEEWERQEREREQREKDEKERKERQQAREKSKTPRGTSKQNSPIDLADTTVGKSPGRLGDTLTSVWGSQSKAVTPAASPWPSSKSVGPTTPKIENPQPTESRKLTPRNVQTKLSTPATPALGEAQQSFAAELTFDEPTKDLFVQVPQHRDVGSTEGAGHTPADSIPPDQFTTVGASQESADAQVTESNMESYAQGGSARGDIDGWDNLTSRDWASGGQSGGGDWNNDPSQSSEANKTGLNAAAPSLPSLGWGLNSNKWSFSPPKSFGSSLTGAFGGIGNLLATGDHRRDDPKTTEQAAENFDAVPLGDITPRPEDGSTEHPPADAFGTTEPTSEQTTSLETGPTGGMALALEVPHESAHAMSEQPPVASTELHVQTESGDPQENGGAEDGEGGAEGAGVDGQPGADEEAEEEWGQPASKKKKKKGKGGSTPQTPIEPTTSGGGGGGGGGNKKKKKK